MNLTTGIMFIAGFTTGLKTDQSNLREKYDLIDCSKYVVGISIFVAEVAGRIMGYGFFETSKSIVAATVTGMMAGVSGSLIGRIFSKYKVEGNSIILDVKLAAARSAALGSAQIIFPYAPHLLGVAFTARVLMQ